MNKYSAALMIAHITFSVFALSNDQSFTIAIESHWKDLECSDCKHIERFGGKWILVGSIIFKKKAKETVNLARLTLQWNGEQLNNLTASLYKEEPDKEFLPIQDFLICDGTWNPITQTIQFNFEKQESLGFVNKFHLVLTVPPTIEAAIKLGNFTIVKNTLPDPFRIALDTNALAIHFPQIMAAV